MPMDDFDKYCFSLLLFMQTGYIRLLNLEHLAWFALETRGGWKTGGENRSPGG